MPKTGTTALQGFLRGNRRVLPEIGLRYMEAGRRRPDGAGNLPISHNRIVFGMNQRHGNLDEFRKALAEEYAAHRDKTCLVSSEMFYTVDMVRLAEVFADIPADEVKITFYCRRYSDFFEADYKQRAKNGRIQGGATGYVRQRLEEIEAAPERHNFSGRVEQIRAAFPGAAIEPRLYDRRQMRNGNVIDDFFDRMGVAIPDGVSTDMPANPSLSRVASEAFGIVTRAMGKKESRRLRRQAVTGPVMLRRRDVLEADERAWLDDYLAASDAAFANEFFPDRDTLFRPVALSEEERAFRRDSPEEAEAFHRACEIVFRMALLRQTALRSADDSS
ncbi:hypothetical protein AVO45_01795 [Ruegeria marisrubri]|uniref:Uncharacterized protein n=1 Tax=Ruegeria marisrubri TaxID=1685379 RepID=A0A117KH37_9RHOB|nr:hypothetical protein [Ruegeria marisrubri]KUJ85741.1 hypothetical protein AVO45_01795 [Ruegeria marisrubri]